ncbi:DNA mismatch repair protein MutL [Salsuginibacillus halophilus]|uniref:DNA mismatch repair protein MutL n=1 Tax=Salsuginibacillus halophilus TaxID=517424 RepID=A0A2P8HYH3_9BACI|nr:DNA mismatch repair endonuclease MutL [Salsuginibacillus halophilus]PSL51270.1 DNA mismatch repair protein MutL [Salsuginibacillus halophilus]
MGHIQLLNDQLTNKIAAGEVVERPASVVKELVENAVDAGSTQIEIEAEEAGLSFIRVTDNGHGMDENDAKQAVFRHATSKIATEDDLFSIQTLGFRGEALPSIASVARLELETGTGDGPGMHFAYQGGHLIAESKTQARQGTTIAVHELFFNTPARLKHMKTINTELGRMTDVVNRMALAHPNISFLFTHNGRRILFTNGYNDLQTVIASIYGRQTAKKMVTVEKNTADYSIYGFVGLPEVYRASRNYISAVINGRYVQHIPLARAVEKAYHTLLPIGKYPVVVLHITMDPVLVDVNVHPAKLDVRLSKEEELLESITEAVGAALKKERLIPDTGAQAAKEKAANAKQIPLSFPQTAAKTEEVFEETSEAMHHQISHVYESPAEIRPAGESAGSSVDGFTSEAEKVTTPTTATTEPSSEDRETAAPDVPHMEPIGQLHGTYILAQNEDGLFMIDQHAAEERLKYEWFKKKTAEVTPHVQELLMPLTLELSPDEAALVEDKQAPLEEVGVFLERFGTHTYRVRATPVWFPEGDEKSVIQEILEHMKNRREVHVGELKDEAAMMMACKAAIKANRHLRTDEMLALIQDLQACEDPYTCPHGRPIIIHFSTYDMEKMFKRVMN